MDRANQPATAIVHKVDAGEIIMVTVPTGGNERATDQQHCFVWRDAEFKTATLSCPSDQQDTVVEAAPQSSWPAKTEP